MQQIPLFKKFTTSSNLTWTNKDDKIRGANLRFVFSTRYATAVYWVDQLFSKIECRLNIFWFFIWWSVDPNSQTLLSAYLFIFFIIFVQKLLHNANIPLASWLQSSPSHSCILLSYFHKSWLKKVSQCNQMSNSHLSITHALIFVVVSWALNLGISTTTLRTKSHVTQHKIPFSLTLCFCTLSSVVVIFCVDSNKGVSMLHYVNMLYNMNCYLQFRTERGLRQYLWHSVKCRDYLLEQRCTDAGIETINTAHRQSYGIQCVRLNHKMNAKPPLYYAPYKEFQYDAASNFDADGTTHLARWLFLV